MKILFVNACVRTDSRTLQLARHLLQGLEGDVTEINLEKENIAPLKRKTLEEREALLREGRLDNASFRYSHEFANADSIVIAAPYWDLSFPSLLKIYMEAVTVSGVTFQYDQDIPRGLCRAGELIYITTAGGPIFADFGYSYIKLLAEAFYGIKKTICFKAENLDVEGADAAALIERTKEEITAFIKSEK